MRKSGKWTVVLALVLALACAAGLTACKHKTPDEPPAPQTYVITLQQSPHGTLTADKTEVADGEDVTITVTPDEGYELSQIKASGVDLTDMVENNVLTITDVQCNLTVSAAFRRLPAVARGTVALAANLQQYVGKTNLDLTKTVLFFLTESGSAERAAGAVKADGTFEAMIEPGSYVGIRAENEALMPVEIRTAIEAGADGVTVGDTLTFDTLTFYGGVTMEHASSIAPSGGEGTVTPDYTNRTVTMEYPGTSSGKNTNAYAGISVRTDSFMIEFSVNSLKKLARDNADGVFNSAVGVTFSGELGNYRYCFQRCYPLDGNYLRVKKFGDGGADTIGSKVSLKSEDSPAPEMTNLAEAFGDNLDEPVYFALALRSGKFHWLYKFDKAEEYKEFTSWKNEIPLPEGFEYAIGFSAIDYTSCTIGNYNLVVDREAVADAIGIEKATITIEEATDADWTIDAVTGSLEGNVFTTFVDETVTLTVTPADGKLLRAIFSDIGSGKGTIAFTTDANNVSTARFNGCTTTLTLDVIDEREVKNVTATVTVPEGYLDRIEAEEVVLKGITDNQGRDIVVIDPVTQKTAEGFTVTAGILGFDDSTSYNFTFGAPYFVDAVAENQSNLDEVSAKFTRTDFTYNPLWNGDDTDLSDGTATTAKEGDAWHDRVAYIKDLTVGGGDFMMTFTVTDWDLSKTNVWVGAYFSDDDNAVNAVAVTFPTDATGGKCDDITGYQYNVSGMTATEQNYLYGSEFENLGVTAVHREPFVFATGDVGSKTFGTIKITVIRREVNGKSLYYVVADNGEVVVPVIWDYTPTATLSGDITAGIWMRRGGGTITVQNDVTQDNFFYTTDSDDINAYMLTANLTYKVTVTKDNDVEYTLMADRVAAGASDNEYIVPRGAEVTVTATVKNTGKVLRSITVNGVDVPTAYEEGVATAKFTPTAKDTRVAFDLVDTANIKEFPVTVTVPEGYWDELSVENFSVKVKATEGDTERTILSKKSEKYDPLTGKYTCTLEVIIVEEGSNYLEATAKYFAPAKSTEFTKGTGGSVTAAFTRTGFTYSDNWATDATDPDLGDGEATIKDVGGSFIDRKATIKDVTVDGDFMIRYTVENWNKTANVWLGARFDDAEGGYNVVAVSFASSDYKTCNQITGYQTNPGNGKEEANYLYGSEFKDETLAGGEGHGKVEKATFEYAKNGEFSNINITVIRREVDGVGKYYVVADDGETYVPVIWAYAPTSALTGDDITASIWARRGGGTIKVQNKLGEDGFFYTKDAAEIEKFMVTAGLAYEITVTPSGSVDYTLSSAHGKTLDTNKYLAYRGEEVTVTATVTNSDILDNIKANEQALDLEPGEGGAFTATFTPTAATTITFGVLSSTYIRDITATVEVPEGYRDSLTADDIEFKVKDAEGNERRIISSETPSYSEGTGEYTCTLKVAIETGESYIEFTSNKFFAPVKTANFAADATPETAAFTHIDFTYDNYGSAWSTGATDADLGDGEATIANVSNDNNRIATIKDLTVAGGDFMMTYAISGWLVDKNVFVGAYFRDDENNYNSVGVAFNGANNKINGFQVDNSGADGKLQDKYIHGNAKVSGITDSAQLFTYASDSAFGTKDINITVIRRIVDGVGKYYVVADDGSTYVPVIWAYAPTSALTGDDITASIWARRGGGTIKVQNDVTQDNFFYTKTTEEIDKFMVKAGMAYEIEVTPSDSVNYTLSDAKGELASYEANKYIAHRGDEVTITATVKNEDVLNGIKADGTSLGVEPGSEGGLTAKFTPTKATNITFEVTTRDNITTVEATVTVPEAFRDLISAEDIKVAVKAADSHEPRTILSNKGGHYDAATGQYTCKLEVIIVEEGNNYLEATAKYFAPAKSDEFAKGTGGSVTAEFTRTDFTYNSEWTTYQHVFADGVSTNISTNDNQWPARIATINDITVNGGDFMIRYAVSGWTVTSNCWVGAVFQGDGGKVNALAVTFEKNANKITGYQSYVEKTKDTDPQNEGYVYYNGPSYKSLDSKTQQPSFEYYSGSAFSATVNITVIRREVDGKSVYYVCADKGDGTYVPVIWDYSPETELTGDITAGIWFRRGGGTIKVQNDVTQPDFFFTKDKGEIDEVLAKANVRNITVNVTVPEAVRDITTADDIEFTVKASNGDAARTLLGKNFTHYEEATGTYTFNLAAIIEDGDSYVETDAKYFATQKSSGFAPDSSDPISFESFTRTDFTYANTWDTNATDSDLSDGEAIIEKRPAAPNLDQNRLATIKGLTVNGGDFMMTYTISDWLVNQNVFVGALFSYDPKYQKGNRNSAGVVFSGANNKINGYETEGQYIHGDTELGKDATIAEKSAQSFTYASGSAFGETAVNITVIRREVDGKSVYFVYADDGANFVPVIWEYTPTTEIIGHGAISASIWVRRGGGTITVQNDATQPDFFFTTDTAKVEAFLSAHPYN